MDDNLTPAEVEQSESINIDGEEEHRYAEFEDICNRLENLSDMVKSIVDWTNNANSAMVQNGEVVTDADNVIATDIDADGDTDLIGITPDIDPDELSLD